MLIGFLMVACIVPPILLFAFIHLRFRRNVDECTRAIDERNEEAHNAVGEIYRAGLASVHARIAASPRYTYDDPFVPPVPKGGE